MPGVLGHIVHEVRNDGADLYSASCARCSWGGLERQKPETAEVDLYRHVSKCRGDR
jgi:hypothetical protein